MSIVYCSYDIHRKENRLRSENQVRYSYVRGLCSLMCKQSHTMNVCAKKKEDGSDEA